MSWAGKILRVNLTAGTVKSEPLNMEWAKPTSAHAVWAANT
jgi:aldehyde:ferredoxin oxidoreductase